MKLISCHIENFGALSSFNLNFDAGLTALYSPNGGGKSTLTAFIRAMFYGLPSDTARSRFNDRRHYYPFSGGKFGGNITFEWKGNVYRIERFFGRASGEELKVYRNDLPCADMNGMQPGEAVFGLDEPSFCRTLCISGDIGELAATGGIAARLGDYAPSSAADGGARSAADVLERAAKNLQSRGGRGRIPQLEEKVKALQADISNINGISARLGEKYAEYAALQEAISREEESRRLEGERALAEERWARLDDMYASAGRAEARMAQIAESYPGGLPTEESIAALRASPQSAGANGKGGAGKLPTCLSFILSAILIIGGCALFAFNTFAAVAALCAGVLFAVATLAVIFGGRKSKSRPASDNSADADKMERDLAEWRALSGEAERAKAQAEEYRKNYGLTARPAARGESPRGDGGEMRLRLASLAREISDDESIAEGLGAKRDELELASSELRELKEKYADYLDAAEHIRRAERALGRKYVAPVAESFSRYSALLKNALGGNVYVDKNFAVAFEGGGELRSEGHFSGGQRAVISLCYRLALIDNIFGGDLPFVIMDDPFAELDEEHMQAAAGMLAQLARERQIIYLYCHKSRAV